MNSDQLYVKLLTELDLLIADLITPEKTKPEQVPALLSTPVAGKTRRKTYQAPISASSTTGTTHRLMRKLSFPFFFFLIYERVSSDLIIRKSLHQV